jgi:hypothetical protein
MAKFEVHIPAAQGGFNITLRVEADNWMAALKFGMAKLGEQGSSVQNLLVDIQDDNSFHVTESQSGRVFQIRELSEQEAATAEVKKPTAPPPSSQATTQPGLPVFTEPPPAPVPPPVVKRGPSSSPKALEVSQIVELEKPILPVVSAIGRPAVKVDEKEQVEDLLSEVFERVQEIYTLPSDEAAMYFLLDLALEKIPAESGSVYRADSGMGDLSFTAARGPKASELLKAKLVIPAGTGIAGFCSIEGVSVALSEVEKDPRFYKAISEKLSYPTRSVLCAPMMTHGRAFGCLQLLNKKNSALFGPHEVGLLSYLAHQGALFLNTRS